MHLVYDLPLGRAPTGAVLRTSTPAIDRTSEPDKRALRRVIHHILRVIEDVRAQLLVPKQ